MQFARRYQCRQRNSYIRVKLQCCRHRQGHVNFSVSGTILLVENNSSGGNFTGLPQVTDRQLTITGPITIAPSSNSQEFSQVMQIAPDAALSLDDVTIVHSLGFGGSAISNSGTLTLTNCMFSENSSTAGGAIVNSGKLTVTNSTFSGNGTIEGPADISNSGTMTISNSTFSDNGQGHYSGGAIDNSGTATITSSTFSGNDAGDGGAIYNGGTLTVINSTFSGNNRHRRTWRSGRRHL